MPQEAPAEAHYIGQERVPVLVADAVALGADRMRELAQTRPFAVNGPHYPGIRSRAPRTYADMIADNLAGPIGEIMGWKAPRFEVIASDFSLVTKTPETLTPFQRLPHFDGTDEGVIAVLHFLCGSAFGGTAFFRHKVTGFETVTADRLERYNDVLRADVTTNGLPDPSYVTGSTALFEETAMFPARYGRLLAYPGISLHSGRIPEGMPLTDDPAKGRLTVNTFLRRVE